MPRLAWAGDLAQLATAHSRDMARRPFFGHTNPRGLAPADCVREAGLCVIAEAGHFLLDGVGENLLLTHRYTAYYVVDLPDGTRHFEFEWKSVADLAEEAVTLWMSSHAHRQNLLSPLYRAAGIGIVHTDHETLFVTQNLAVLPPERIASL